MAAVGLLLVMRVIIVILCGALLFASLLGLAHLNGPADATHLGDNHATLHVQDVLCGEGSGHAACQLVVAGSSEVPNFTAPAGIAPFETLPVKASGRSFPPQTPPPRQHS